MDGLLIIDKPVGLTSHDVVNRVRRILGTKRVGHTGTLDPFATGVLVMLIGRATRLVQFIDKDEKEYEAVVRFGFETDTGDRTGTPKSNVQSPMSLTTEDIERVLPNFRGEIEQIPPMYSAKKVEGKKLYEHARKGVDIERKSISVRIVTLEIMSEPALADFGHRTLDIGLHIMCSAGAYIRTLAEDIGRAVGAGAHLQELRRVRAGKFDISNAITLEELEAEAGSTKRLLPMTEAVAHLPEFRLTAVRTEKTLNGLSTRTEGKDLKDCDMVRMTDVNGELLAIGMFDAKEGRIQPKIVLA